MRNKTKIIIFFLFCMSLHIFADSPEIHYLEPGIIPYGIPTKVTVVGKNFVKNLNISLSSKDVYLLSTWNGVQEIEDFCIKDKNIYIANGIRGLKILQIKEYNQPLKFIGGYVTNTPIHKVFVEDNYAYIVDDKSMYVLDISDISNPAIIEKIVLPGTPIATYAKNGFVYLGYGTNGCQIIDANKPKKLKIVSHSLSLNAYNFFISNEFLYIASGEQGLTIFDNKKPEQPLLINTYKIPGFVNSLYEENNYIYLACGNEGIQIFDISNKSNVEFIKKIEYPREIKLVNKNENFLFAVAGNEFLVFDISKMDKPRLIRGWKSEAIINKALYSDEYVFLIDNAGNVQVLANLWKIDNYRYTDQNLIVIMIPDTIPPNTYDLTIINKEEKTAVSLQKSIIITQPNPKINFINPRQITEGDKNDLICIGDNFQPGLLLKIDSTLCTNIEVYSKGKIKASFQGNLPKGCYTITVINPDGQSVTTEKIFCIIEKTLTLEKVTPEAIINDDVKRNVEISGKKLTKISKIVLWGNGPYKISNCDTPGNALSLFVAKDYCFVADEFAGLTILDIAHPEIPNIIAKQDTLGACNGLALHSNFAYLADGEYGIQILDIKYPDKPSLVWSQDTPGFAFSLAIYRNYIYVADGKSGFSIFYMENPYNLTPIGSFRTKGAIYSLAIKDNYAFLACGDFGVTKGEGIVILDISTPDSPQIKTVYSTEGSVNSLQLINNLLYVACGDAGLIILDVTNPTAPIFVGGYNLGINLFNIYVDTETKYAYASAGKKGVIIFDVSTSNNPYPIASYKTSDAANYTMTKNNLAYIACSQSGVEIIDVNNAGNPMQFNSIAKPNQAIDLAIYENYVYLPNQKNGLLIFDTKSPRIKIEKEIQLEGKAMSIEINDNYAYITCGKEGLQIFSLDDPINPKQIGSLPLPGVAYNITIKENRAYISCVDDGVHIVDIDSPSNPKLLGTIKTDNKAYSTFIKDKYAYIAQYIGGLSIVDISKPNLTQKISSINTKGFANDVQVKDKYAYVAASDMGLIIIDISDPEKPEIISSCKIDGNANAVKIDNDIAYLASTTGGIFFIDISNPKNPMLLGNYSTLGASYNLCIKDKKLYVLDSNFGLIIYNAPIIIDKFTSIDENTIGLNIPNNLNTGAYNITLINNEEGSIFIKNNIFKIIKK